MALQDVLDAFASSEPYPGGGSAAALAGALGVSLLLMAAGVKRTRTGSPDEAAELAQASAHLRPLRVALTRIVDADSEAYQAVIAAMRLPKATEEEAEARRQSIQAAMRGATETPLETMRACREALRSAAAVAANASRNAGSDVAVAIELLAAAMRAAGINVDTNLGGLRDPAFTGSARAERQELETGGLVDAERAMKGLS